MFSVYILFSEKLNQYYVGTTSDISRRLLEHNIGIRKNSHTFKGKPWRLVLEMNNLTSDQAYRIERHIKSMKSAKYIANLIKYKDMQDRLKQRFT